MIHVENSIVLTQLLFKLLAPNRGRQPFRHRVPHDNILIPSRAIYFGGHSFVLSNRETEVSLPFLYHLLED